MAFVAANSHVLARELWPQGLGKLEQDKHHTVQSLPASRVVARGQQELLEWLFVQLIDRGRRARVFVQPSVQGAESSPELVIRLQGIIGDLNLGLCGDWNQTEENTKKAMQRLTLVAGSCREGFVPQVKALEDIRQTVSMMVGVCPRRVDAGGKIFLRRRVFTKVVGDTPSSVVTDREDPGGELGAIDDKWRITSRLKCGDQKPNGVIEVLHPFFLRAGDMVDVSVSVVAVVVDGPSGKRCDVIFEPKTVVRLAEEDKVKIAFEKEAEKARGARRRPIDAGSSMQEGYSFGAKASKVRKVEDAVPMEVVVNVGPTSARSSEGQLDADGLPLIVGDEAASVFT